MWIQNLGSFLPSSALTNRCDWILPRFKPFISDGLIKHHSHKTTIARKLTVSDAAGNLSFFVKQKAFKLKEPVTVFADVDQQVPLYELAADRVIDFSASYHFKDARGWRPRWYCEEARNEVFMEGTLRHSQWWWPYAENSGGKSMGQGL